MVDKKFLAIEINTGKEALKAFEVLKYDSIWKTTRNRLKKGNVHELYKFLIFDTDQWVGSPDSDDRMVVNPFDDKLPEINYFKHLYGRKVMFNGEEVRWNEDLAKKNNGEYTPMLIIRKRKKNEK